MLYARALRPVTCAGAGRRCLAVALLKSAQRHSVLGVRAIGLAASFRVAPAAAVQPLSKGLALVHPRSAGVIRVWPRMAEPVPFGSVIAPVVPTPVLLRLLRLLKLLLLLLRTRLLLRTPLLLLLRTPGTLLMMVLRTRLLLRTRC